LDSGSYIQTPGSPPKNRADGEGLPSGSTIAIESKGDLLPELDNVRNCGNASKRWKLVRAVTITPGDLVFENSYRVTEDETDGLAFKNDAGEKIAVLDREGNFHIKGKFISDL
jgi:hypothetical protein